MASKAKISRDSRASTSLRRDRSRKKRRPSNPFESEKEEEAKTSASAQKLQGSKHFDVPINDFIGYVILNFLTVFSAISASVKCKQCGNDVTFNRASERGLSFKIIMTCNWCQPVNISSCPYIRSTYEINRRFFFAMRLLGVGLAGATTFCGIMDLHRPVFHNTYDLIVNSLVTASDAVCKMILSRSVQEEKKKTMEANNWEEIEGPTKGLTVSGDGTWRKRGFNSLHGVSAIIGYYSGKVLDIVVKCSFCKACEFWENKKDTAEYVEWLDSHQENCSANHQGSAGKMEFDAIREMFERSESSYGIKYINYIGDGDSKTYKGVVDASPYGPSVVVNKKECVGHVQKRMGTRLRVCKKKTTGLGGKGKLTAKLIDELTVYYGLAIRRNSDSVEKMKDAIWSTFHHKCSTNAEPRHDNCPQGPESWCSWQQAKAAGTLQHYEHKTPLHDDVIRAIRPIYENLSDDNLLERCVGGFTQNTNESLNNVIWRMAPKVQHSGASIVKIAANIAACIFNEGTKTYLLIMQALNIDIGRNCVAYCENQDQARIDSSLVKAQKATRERRIARRQRQSSFHEAAIAAEGTSYGPGIDD